MTQSFIDESTQGQGEDESEALSTEPSNQQSDLMTSSFMGDAIPGEPGK